MNTSNLRPPFRNAGHPKRSSSTSWFRLSRGAGMALSVLLALALVLAFLYVGVASAAAPNVRNAYAVVNGVADEWNTSPLNATNPDWFSASCAPAGTTCATPSGDIFLRYDCPSQTLYILGMARAGNTYAVGDSANNWIAQTSIDNKIIRDTTPYTSNVAPPMWRDLLNGRGFEAALTFAPGTYSLNFHMFVHDTTSGTDFQTVILTCGPTAVTVDRFGANPGSELVSMSNTLALGLAAVGVTVLGLLAFVIARKC